MPKDTSDRVIEGINRYAEEIPIVFGSAIGGPADAPELDWEAPWLEVAREGLLMTGRGELESTIAQLGLKIDELGGPAGVPVAAEYAAVHEQAGRVARAIIEDAGGELLDDLLLPPAEPEAVPVSDLLERLFRSTREGGDGDDPETEEE